MFWGGSTRTYDCVSFGAGACLDASIAGVLGRLSAHGSMSLYVDFTGAQFVVPFRCFYHISISITTVSCVEYQYILSSSPSGCSWRLCTVVQLIHFLVLTCSEYVKTTLWTLDVVDMSFTFIYVFGGGQGPVFTPSRIESCSSRNSMNSSRITPCPID